MRARRVWTLLAATVAVGLLGIPDAGAATPAPAPATEGARRPADPGWSPAYQATLDRYAAQSIDWQPCFDDGTSPDFECAWIRVPMDWANPRVGDIDVAITRILATGRRIGVLQTNPGGPGGAGWWVPLYLQESQPELAARYDLVGMDPRGVEASTPLECAGTDALSRMYSLDGQDRSPANVQRFLQTSRQEATGCATDPLTKYITTEQTVRDIDLVRTIFGDRTTSWLGWSAGTWMGAWYATQFPSHVGRFVLDGNVNFTTTWYDDFRDQPAGFQRRFEQDLLPYLARYDHLLGLGDTARAVRRTYERRRAELNAHPLRLTDGTRLTGALYDYAIAGMLYADAQLPDLATTLSAIERWASATSEERDAVTEVFAFAGADQSDHVFWSTICNDTPEPPQSVVFRDWLTIGTRYPFTGSTWLGDPCQYWQLPSIGSPVTGAGIPPILMIQNDGDPATPYIGGLKAHRNTPGSVLLTVRNEGDHTMYANGDQCVDDVANRWFLRGQLPAGDRSCPGVPPPDLDEVLGAGAAARSASAASAAALPVGVWGQRFTATHPRPAQR